jgi:hypothetical protein
MAGSVSAQISNSLVSLFNIHKPDKANFLFRKYGKQGVTAFQFLQSIGAVSPVAQGTFSHFEEDWIHATFTPSAVGAGGAGVTVNVTLSAADMDSLGNSYPRVGDIVMFNNGVKGQVLTKSGANPAVLGIAPLLVADDIATSAIVGEQVIITSNAFAEGTDQPEGRVSKAYEYSFYTQILKETVASTGTELTNQNWFNEIDGTTINAWFDKAKSIDLDYRMALAIDGMILYGEVADNPNITGTTAQGLVDGVSTQGGNATYTPGLFSLAYFDQMNRYLDKQMAPNEYVGLLGYQFFQDMENTLTNVFTQNPIIFAGGEGKTFGELMYGDNMKSLAGKSVEIGFRSITKTDRTFHLLKLPQLSNPKLYGATGFTEQGRGIFCPLDKPIAPKGGAMPRLGVRYKELGGYSRKMESWYIGGAGNIPVKTTGVDNIQLNSRAEMGAEQFGLNSFYQFTVS